MSHPLFRRPAAVLAAGGLVLAAGLGPAGASTTGWRVVKVFGVSSQIFSVAATSRSDAWAAGASCGNPCSSLPLLFEHWNGASWTKISPPAGLSTTVGDAVVAATSASDAWAFADVGANTDYAEALRWDGAKWAQTTKFPAWSSIRAAVAPAASDVWAFGLVISPSAPYIAHYNGATWKRVKLPIWPQDASATSPRDIWVIGQPTGTSSGPVTTMHYDGSSWRTAPLPKITLPSGDSLMPGYITAVSPTDVWADAIPTKGQGIAPGVVLLHYNGSRWSRVAVPYPSYQPSSLASDGSGGLWMSIYNSAYQQQLYHYRNGRWSRLSAPAPAGDSAQLSALARIPGARSVWGVGEAIPNPNPQGISQGLILKDGP